MQSRQRWPYRVDLAAAECWPFPLVACEAIPGVDAARLHPSKAFFLKVAHAEAVGSAVIKEDAINQSCSWAMLRPRLAHCASNSARSPHQRTATVGNGSPKLAALRMGCSPLERTSKTCDAEWRRSAGSAPGPPRPHDSKQHHCVAPSASRRSRPSSRQSLKRGGMLSRPHSRHHQAQERKCWRGLEHRRGLELTRPRRRSATTTER